jgi:hypothetical protein
MSGSKPIALGAVVVVGLAVFVVGLSWPAADADDHGRQKAVASTPAVPALATNRNTVGGDFVLPVDGNRPLITVAGLGRFSVRCRSQHRLQTTLRSTVNETVFVTVDEGGARPRAAVVDPGKRFQLATSGGAATTQRWQIARINDAFTSVALVFVASSPPYGSNPTCAVSAYAVGPTKQPRK